MHRPKPPTGLSTQNSPPLEGCPQDGVVSKTGCPKEDVVSRTGDQQDGVVQQDEVARPNARLKNCYLINDVVISHRPKLKLPYNPKLKERAKALRYAYNLSEVLFWLQVTKNRFHKIDFDRQRVIGNFIVDFYVKKLGLVIEIDGSSHDNKFDYDRKREQYLLNLGLKVYRISVGDVMRNMEFALMGLENYIIEEYGAQK